MVLEIGTLILANYTAKIRDTGEAIETTLEEEAKKLGIHDPSRKYEPKLISVGEGWVLKGLDDVLQSANVGEKKVIELPPEKAFGARDPTKVRPMPLRKFGEKAGDLRIGEMVEIDDKVGIVRSMGSGRAQIDFNHRLAGKTLVYEVEVIKKLEEDSEKITALIKRRMPMEEEKLSFSIEDGLLKIPLHSDYYLVEGLQITKKAVSADIFKFLKTIKKIIFIEEYEGPKTKEEPEPVDKLENKVVEEPKGNPDDTG